MREQWNEYMKQWAQNGIHNMSSGMQKTLQGEKFRSFLYDSPKC